jgi:hypothetical protein
MFAALILLLLRPSQLAFDLARLVPASSGFSLMFNERVMS